MKSLLVAIFIFTIPVLHGAEPKKFVFNDGSKPSFHKFVTAQQLERLRRESDLVILDVRLQEDFAKDPKMIPGAKYLDPAKLPSWLDQIDKDK